MKSDSTIAHGAAEYTALALMAAGGEPVAIADAFVSAAAALLAAERPETALALLDAYAEALHG